MRCVKQLAFIVVCHLLGEGSGYSQTSFLKTYKRNNTVVFEKVKPLPDGTYIAAGGSSGTTLNSLDILLVKTDANGDTLWTRSYGGNYDDLLMFIEQTNDGGYLFGSATKSFGSNPGSDEDAYLVKIDQNGDTLWTRTYGGPGYDGFLSAKQLPDGGYICAGYTNMLAGTNGDFFLVRLNSSGDTLWAKAYGGSYGDTGIEVFRTNDNGFLLVGFTFSFGVNDNDFYLVKTDSSGNLLWSKTYGGNKIDYLLAACETQGYLLVGMSKSYGAGIDTTNAIAVNVDTAGNVLWSKVYAWDHVNSFQSVIVQAQNTILFCGYIQQYPAQNTRGAILKTDVNGDTLLAKLISSGISLSDIIPTSDGGFAACGDVSSSAGLIKADANNNIGCNEATATTRVRNITLTVTSPPTQQYATNTTVRSTQTQVSRGATVTTYCSYIGVAEEKENEGKLSIFPNPNSGTFSVVCDGAPASYLELYSIEGRRVRTYELTPGKTTYEITDTELQAGLYIYKLFTPNKAVQNGKLMIIR